jgi:hypothetical protein
MTTAIRKRLKSKTYWLGLAVFVLGLLETAQATNTLPEILSGKEKALATLALSVIIFVLREATAKPLALK